MKAISTILLLVLSASAVQAQRYEKVEFGDFENWVVRYVKESQILGGQTKIQYAVGPRDTIRENKVYDYSNTIWGCSNAYAVVAGITKSTCSAMPEKGPDGYCARLETKMIECKAAGIINIRVLAQGSVFWGKVREPISGTSKPYSFMDWGIPFTKRPKAMILDYKAEIPNTGKIVKGKKTVDGYDPGMIMLLLQHRWEDSDGNIHARRVGTISYTVDKSTGSWRKDFRIPVIYGDARKSPSYRDYMNLLGGDDSLYATNGKGRPTPILEEAWGSPEEEITHAVMAISSGSCSSFAGALGNILWIDNIKLEY